MATSVLRNGLGAAAFAVAGVLFLLYPAVRPWEDETTLQGAARAMASSAWVASHLFAMLGFILLALGVLALRDSLRPTPARSLGTAAVVTTWAGAGLTLPYYGAETFGLHAVATHAAEGQPIDIVAVAEAFRYQPVALVTFAAGLLLLAAGAILAAAAIRRSGVLPRYAGVPLAVGVALFLPQFFTPPGVRIGHGVLMAIGAGWIAWSLARAATDRGAPAEESPSEG